MHLNPAKITGLLLGTAVGDALGLPREGLTPRRAKAVFGDELRHRFFLGRGMCSDDTEHAVFTAQALIASRGDHELFAKEIASRLRWWALRLPAGIGFATLRACAKLWVGFSAKSSGVFSAGNGPAMRAPIIGAFAADDLSRLKALVRDSTRLTHTDPKAEWGALAIALCARRAMIDGPSLNRDELFEELYREIQHDELVARLRHVQTALTSGLMPSDFAKEMGFVRGVSGYILDTIPTVIFCWVNSLTDYQRAVMDIIRLGGDADTTGAIVGALSGATLGKAAIPAEWLSGVIEWPHTVAWIEELCNTLCGPVKSTAMNARFLDGVCILIRNVPFMFIVLGHGFRRLFPPY